LICLVNERNEKWSFEGLDCVEQLFLFFKNEMLDNNFGNSNKHDSALMKHLIWSFNGAKFDYLFLVSMIVKNFSCNILGNATNLKEI
jgi:hypothetical protein